MGKRIIWMDALKGFCILLVVYCHNVILPNKTIIGNLMMALATAGVPCFMMVSGALLHNTPSFSWQKYFQRLGKIYISLIAWRIIYLLISSICFNPHFSKVELFKYLFLFGSIGQVPSEVMWYMIALLLVLLIYPISYFLFHEKNTNGKIFIFLLILSFLGGFLVPVGNYLTQLICQFFGVPTIDLFGIYSILPFSQHSNLLFFFLLGALLHKNDSMIKEKLARYPKLIPYSLIATGVIGLTIMKFTMSGTFYWQGIGIESGYNRLSAIILSIGMWLTFSTQNGKFNKFLSTYIGKYTMGIYYVHFILLAVCTHYFYPYINDYIIGMNLIKTLIITSISVLIVRIMLSIPIIKEIFK